MYVFVYVCVCLFLVDVRVCVHVCVDVRALCAYAMTHVYVHMPRCQTTAPTVVLFFLCARFCLRWFRRFLRSALPGAEPPTAVRKAAPCVLTFGGGNLSATHRKKINVKAGID